MDQVFCGHDIVVTGEAKQAGRFFPQPLLRPGLVGIVTGAAVPLGDRFVDNPQFVFGFVADIAKDLSRCQKRKVLFNRLGGVAGIAACVTQDTLPDIHGAVNEFGYAHPGVTLRTDTLLGMDRISADKKDTSHGGKQCIWNHPFSIHCAPYESWNR
jgi:hypothetical protein